MTELPAQFYYIVGFLIVTNIGAIGSTVMVGFKVVWWASKTDGRVTELEKDMNAAHTMIRNQKENKYASIP